MEWQRAEQDRPEAADNAALVEEQVLPGRADFRRVELQYEGVVAVEHAHQCAGPQHGWEILSATSIDRT
jgi:hypothetical protein